MNCIFWNVRGLTNSSIKLSLKRLVRNSKPKFVFIAEPWTDKAHFPYSWLSRLNMKFFDVNIRNHLLPNLWCLCDSDPNPEVL